MKTYVITLSKVFPTGHKRAGEPTAFKSSFETGQIYSKCKQRIVAMCAGECLSVLGGKIHTIRANYPLWQKRISEVQRGEAVLSVRQWTGKPYRSPQEQIDILTNEDGVGIQELKMIDLFRPTEINGNRVELPDLAENDGLTFDDWYQWFKGYDLTQPMAIIHFTKFRY